MRSAKSARDSRESSISQKNVKKLSGQEHFWKMRSAKSARGCIARDRFYGHRRQLSEISGHDGLDAAKGLVFAAAALQRRAMLAIITLQMPLLEPSFIHSFLPSFVRSLSHPCIHPSMHTFIPFIPLIHSYIMHSFIQNSSRMSSFISFYFSSVQFTSFQLTNNSYQQNVSYNHVLFLKFPPRRVPGTTW